MTDIDLVRQILGDAATLYGAPAGSVSVTLGTTIELKAGAGESVKIAPQWAPEGGGIIETLDLAPALAHHLRHDARHRVGERDHAVTVARRALEVAEKAHADAVALRDRLAAIVDAGVAEARARRVSKSGA